MHYDYNFVVTLTLTQPKTNSCFSSRISAYIFGMFPNSNFTLNLLFILNTGEVRRLSQKTFKSVYWIVFQTNICEASQAKINNVRNVWEFFFFCFSLLALSGRSFIRSDCKYVDFQLIGDLSQKDAVQTCYQHPLARIQRGDGLCILQYATR